MISRFSFLLLLLAATGCARSTAYWTEQMKSPESATRLHAVYALRERTKEANVVVPALLDALKDEDAFIRRDAARALGKFGPEATEALPALHALQHDKEPSVRKAALQSAKQIDPTAASKAAYR